MVDIDFFLKLPQLRVDDPLELTKVLGMLSPGDFNLWDFMAHFNAQTGEGKLYDWVGHASSERTCAST